MNKKITALFILLMISIIGYLTLFAVFTIKIENKNENVERLYSQLLEELEQIQLDYDEDYNYLVKNDKDNKTAISDLKIEFNKKVNEVTAKYINEVKQLEFLLNSLAEEFVVKFETIEQSLIIDGIMQPENLVIYYKEGVRYINFGYYPQSHVSDQDLINSLNKLTNTNSRGYYEFGGKEYSKISSTPDLYGPKSLYKYSDGSTIYYHATEWFLVEPIKWRILYEDEGEYVLLSEMILDSCSFFHDDESSRTIDGKPLYPNNYEYSDIRYFLNNQFLDAFTDEEFSHIVKQYVNNGPNYAYGYDCEFLCDDTNDWVYLLSYKELLLNGYGFDEEESESDFNKLAKVTDYSKARGVWWSIDSYHKGYARWWLRTPSYSYNNYSCIVDEIGSLEYITMVSSSSVGVRPAITITIE